MINVLWVNLHSDSNSIWMSKVVVKNMTFLDSLHCWDCWENTNILRCVRFIIHTMELRSCDLTYRCFQSGAHCSKGNSAANLRDCSVVVHLFVKWKCIKSSFTVEKEADVTFNL